MDVLVQLCNLREHTKMHAQQNCLEQPVSDRMRLFVDTQQATCSAHPGPVCLLNRAGHEHWPSVQILPAMLSVEVFCSLRTVPLAP